MRKVFLSALVLLLLAGCGKKTNMYVSFGIQRGQSTDLHYWGYRGGWAYSDPVIKEMTAFINDDSADVYLPQDYNFFASFQDPDTIPPTVGVEYKFDVKTDVGNAAATCTLPGDFDFTSPLNGDSVPVNAALNITWNTAAGADWYVVSLQFYDTLYNWSDTILNTDSTSWTVPTGWLKSDGWLSIYIYAGDGPKIEPGGAGNVEGALGFCNATNVRDHRVIVGMPTLAASKTPPQAISPIEVMINYLKEMSQ
jgi:hypothetical protein